MKKSMMLIACISTAVMYGMDDQPSFTFNINGTEVQIIKGDISSANGKVGCMVVGRNQQRVLQELAFGDNIFVGRLDSVEDSTLLVKHKDDKSASDDDTYKPYDLARQNTFYEKAQKQAMDNAVVTIVEPRMYRNTEGYFYCYHGYCDDTKRSYTSFRFAGEDALVKAKKDVALCCRKALSKGCKILKDQPDKAIAIDAFGAQSGVPRDSVALAITSVIFEFIQNNPNAYKTIQLFVKKRSEFAFYNMLFDVEIAKMMEEVRLAIEMAQLNQK